MDKFIIRGGKELQGSIKVEGSKNAALPIIIGALLIEKGTTVIHNLAPLRDIETAIRVLEHIGAKIEYDRRSQVMKINAEVITSNTAPYELMRQMRASFLVLGPLLVRAGEARVSLPGGCSLGSRPIDFHIKAFGAMGAEIVEKKGFVIARSRQLNGGAVYFDRPSHTGTENILFGAVLAKHRTVITNAACDPEVVDVAGFLNKAGAKIKGAGTPNIVVEPVKKLKAVEHTVIGDRLVAGTYMFAAAVTGGQVKITGFDPEQLTMVSLKLREMGCEIDTGQQSLTITGPPRLGPVDVTTFPHPGFPTDLQACLMSTACLASGTSHIKETVFIDRFVHTMELRRLGADLSAEGGEAVVQGVKRLVGAQVMAPDIRAGAGLVVACLAAAGKSEVLRVYHIDRGYNKLDDKLASLGADIERTEA